jgi:hypothetical protein
MTELMGFDEQRIGELIRRLPPAPQGWVEAAQILPRARPILDSIVFRAEADLEFRQALLADLEAALAAEGVEPEPLIVIELRNLLEAN